MLLLIVTCLEHERLCLGLGLEAERELVPGLASHGAEGPEDYDRVLFERAVGLTEDRERQRKRERESYQSVRAARKRPADETDSRTRSIGDRDIHYYILLAP